MRQRTFAVLFSGLLAAAIGCGSSDPPEPTAGEVSGANYLASEEPVDSTPVGEARREAADGQEVTLVGLIGGTTEPFVDGIAAFTIVDPKVPHCTPDEGCPTPWDYCCTQDQVAENIATVKVVDEAGMPVTEDARELLGVKELSRVVVSGKVQRDEAGNLTLAADQVYVKNE